MDYPGKVITKTQVTPTQTSASGNWTLDDQAAAIKNNNWPVAGVPNPISKSLRFNSADSAYLNRTPGSAGNQRTFTFSTWVKRCDTGANNCLLSANANVSATALIRFKSDNLLRVYFYDFDSSSSYTLDTAAVFRDPSAWYHIVMSVDTTQATSSNRVILYVNNSLQTLSGSYPTQNMRTYINSTNTHNIGRGTYNSSDFVNGYLTETNFIDGQALTPSDFGLTNPQTGQWIPKKYTGTYGTNGFYLNFKDATSTTTLGYDYSGNANNWTTNNFSVTAGSGNDSLTDVPTPWVAYSTTGDVGGVIRGNYATLNPLPNTSGNVVLTNGNLDYSGSYGSTYALAGSTVGVSSGKWYWEVTLGPTLGPNLGIGVFRLANPNYSAFISGTDGGIGFYHGVANTIYYWNGSAQVTTSYTLAACTTGDVVSVALDLDNGKIYFAKNGSWGASGNPATQTNPALTGLSGTYAGGISVGAAGTSLATFNFGQRPFAYTPPAGFRSLCTTNLPATTIGFGLTNQGDDYFNTVLYTGNATTPRAITGYGFGPEFIVQSRRDTGYGLMYFDIVRGVNKRLTSASDAVEDTYNLVSSFDSDGFTMNVSDQGSNASGGTYVAWGWKAGGTGVTNTAGSISSTVSASTTAGFSVVTYTGTGANATVGHGLGVAPSMIIIKGRNTAYDWRVYHTSVGNTSAVFLNTTSASFSNSTYWNNTSPTSTVFSLGTNAGMNESAKTYVAYCFAAVAGYSAFGSYTGNGSTDGPFVYLGFRPRWIMTKDVTTGYSWNIVDTARNPYNVTGLILAANSTDSENNYSPWFDINSNGFKVRSSSIGVNTNGNTLIYAAFAEYPFQFANAR